jgi:hypothetical protein
MAEPPASGCAMRGAGAVLESFETVAFGVLLLLDEEESDWAVALTVNPARSTDATIHRRRACLLCLQRRDGDLVRKGTIRIRRSHGV